jgi:fibronectin-binding autotransporter adhesin
VTGTSGFLGGVTLNSAGTINQTGGVITADTLSATSVGGATLDQANLLNAAFATNTGSGNISLTNAKILNVGGMTNNVGNIALTVNGGSLIQFGAITATSGTVSLTTTGGSSNGITQTCFLGLCGTITANALTVTSDGTVSLLQANQVAAAGGITGTVTGSGDFLFRNDNTPINVNSVTTQGGRVSLSTTTAGSVSVQSAGIASNGGEIDIAVSPGVTFTNAGAIDSGGGNIVILADAMSLSQGTISGGTVVLGPRTLSTSLSEPAAT